MSGWTSEQFAASGLTDKSYKPGKRAKSNSTPVTRTEPRPSADKGNAPCVPYGEREAAITRRVYLPVTPVGKPRMTQRDKWAKRPAVIRYHDYCDAVRKHWPDIPFPESRAWLVFHIPMAKSWSKKKRREMIGALHQQKPDKDNLEKALLDALFWKQSEHKDDSHIADNRITKIWDTVGYIEVYFDALPPIGNLITSNPDKP